MRVPVLRLAVTWLLVPLLVANVSDGVVDDATAFVAVMPLLFVWYVFALRSAVWAVQSLREGALRESLLYAALPVTLLGTAIAASWPIRTGSFIALPIVVLSAPLTLLGPAMFAGDVAHYLVAKPSYDMQIAALPNTGARFEEFSWGGFAFASRAIVYDETDQIALSPKRRSRAWTNRMRQTDLSCGGNGLEAVARPLWSHYYLASIHC